MALETASQPSPFAELRDDVGCINPVPAVWIPKGFRLLVLRCFHKETEPPAFAWIDQRIFRTPERLSRHGLFFGAAFRPEIMSWLIERLGRPSLAQREQPGRNPDWPTIAWRREGRVWPKDVQTTEWYLDVVFTTEEQSGAFRERWIERLSGRFDG